MFLKLKPVVFAKYKLSYRILQQNSCFQLCTKWYSMRKPGEIYDSRKKTAGIIVIGDEILNGEVHDTNSHFAMKLLHNLGITVKKVSVIGDNVQEIATEVRQFSSVFDYVLTTGGIGPTHDDVTFEGVAKAFQLKLEPNQILVNIVSQFYKTTDMNAPGMKLAFIPETSKLSFGEDKDTAQKVKYPNISVKNVYIFPGIPQLFEKSLSILGKLLFQSSVKFYNRHVYLNVNEQMVVKVLDQMILKYPDVKFGSYPDINNKNYKVKLSIESINEDMVNSAAEDLLKSFKQEEIADNTFGSTTKS